MSRGSCVVLNLGEHWHPNARASVEAACERWDLSLVELRSPLHASAHVFWQKMLAWKETTGERALQIDTDLVVREDCPCPFDYCPKGMFGAVRGLRGVKNAAGEGGFTKLNQQERVIAGYFGWQPWDAGRHCNAGLYVYEPGVHGSMLEWWFDVVGAMFAWQGVWSVADETPLVALERKFPEWRLHLMPRTFNWVRKLLVPEVGDYKDEPPRGMEAYVYHWEGKPKEQRIENTLWRLQDQDPMKSGLLTNETAFLIC